MHSRSGIGRFLALVAGVGLALLAQPGLAQTATTAYTSSDKTVSFSYPAGWVLDDVDSSFGIVMANQQSALELFKTNSATIPSGNLVVLFAPRAEVILDMTADTIGPMSAVDVVAALAKSMIQPGGSNETSKPPTSMTFNNHEGASVVIANPDMQAETHIYVINMGNRKVAVVGLSHQGEMSTYEPDLQALIESIQVSIPAPANTAPVEPAAQSSGTSSTVLTYNSSVSGEISSADSGVWTFTGQAGDAVTLMVTSAVDTDLQLLDPSGVLVASDEDSGGNHNPMISAAVLPVSGVYTVRTSSMDGTSGSYTLKLDKVAAPPGPNKLAYGGFVSARLASADGDKWTFDGKTGDKVSVGAIGAFDTVLELYGPDQAQLTTNDDALGQTDSLIDTFTLPATGEYTVLIRGNSGSVGQYTLMLGGIAASTNGASKP